MVYKLREYSHSFYKVTTCASSAEWGMVTIAYLSVVVFDIIRYKLPQVTELHFCACMAWVAAPTKSCVYSPIWEKSISRASFCGFKRKHQSKMSLVLETTADLSHVSIMAWPVMTSWLLSQWLQNDITQHLFVKFVSCTWMKNFNGEPVLCKFAIYFIHCVLQ